MNIKDEEFYQFMVQALKHSYGIHAEAFYWLEHFIRDTKSKDIKSLMKQTERVGNRYVLKNGWIR